MNGNPTGDSLQSHGLALALGVTKKKLFAVHFSGHLNTYGTPTVCEVLVLS